MRMVMAEETVHRKRFKINSLRRGALVLRHERYLKNVVNNNSYFFAA
jgi:hypothetical protein